MKKIFILSLAFSMSINTLALAANTPPPPPTESGTEIASSPPTGLIGNTGAPIPPTSDVSGSTTPFLRNAVAQSTMPPANSDAAITAFSSSTTNDILGLALIGAEIYTPEQALILLSNLSIKDANLPAYDVQDNQIAFFNQIRHHFALAWRSGSFAALKTFNTAQNNTVGGLTKAAQVRLNAQSHNKSTQTVARSLDEQLKISSRITSPNSNHYTNKHFWGQFLAGHRERRSPTNLASYESTMVGLMVGKDLIVREQEIFGLFVGYQRTDQDKYNRGENEIRQFSAGLYGSLMRQVTKNIAPYLSLMTTAQIARYKEERKTVGTFTAIRATTNHRTYNGLLSGETGVKIDTSYATFSPYAQGSLTSIFKAAHTERNGGDAGLTIHGRRMYLSSTELGLQVSKEFYVQKVRLTPSGRFGWAHQRLLKGRRFRVSYPNSVASYTEVGSTRQKNLYVLEANTSVAATNGLAASLYINGRYGRKFRSNDFGLKVSKAV